MLLFDSFYLFCCFLFVYFLNFHSLIFDNQQRYYALTLYWLSKHHNTRKIFTSNYQPTLERKAKIKKKKYRHICALRISSENHRKVFFFYKMPTASTDSLLASALTKVKHRNSEMVKRDVLTTLHHYRGT